MKKIILLPLLILLLPLVMATNEFGKITSGGDLIIVDVDVKVDSLSSRNLDYGDEISRIANPSSKVIFMIELKNNNSALDMEDVEMIIQIEDLDLEKSTSQVDLSDGQDKVLEITFTLPSDAEERDYEVFIEAEGELNNTIHKVEYELDLVVEEIEEEVVTISSGSCTDIINSMNRTIGQLNQNIDSYFEPYAECVSERDSLKERLNTKDTSISNLQGYETKYTGCNDNLIICTTERIQKAAANESCYYRIANEYLPKIKSQQNYTFLGIAATGIIALLYIQYQKKKDKQGTESEEQGTPDDEAT